MTVPATRGGARGPAVEHRRRRSGIRVGMLAAGLVLVCGARALEPIDHPDPSALSPGVAQAILETRERVERDGDGTADGSAYGDLGMVYQAHEMNVPAAQAYRNAAELTPGDARWPYLLAIIAAENGRLAEALSGFSRSVEINPEYLPARIRRARGRLQMGDRAGAKADLEALLPAASQPTPAGETPAAQAAVLADLGQIALLEDEYARAARHLERALTLQPQANKLHYALALAYRGLGQVDQARAQLALRGDREVIFEDPIVEAMHALSRSYSYYLSRGLAAARSRDFPAALELMRRAVAENPGSAEARIHLARSLEANGDLDAARRELQTVLANEPDQPLARFNLGALEELKGRDRAAIEHYAAAVVVQPELFEAQLLLANSLMRIGQFARAADHYGAALRLRPERSELLLRRGVAEQAAGDCGGAVATLLQLVRRLPEDIEALLAYSRCVASCAAAGPRDRDNALNAARNLYELYPELDFVVTVAMAEAAGGDFSAAVDFQAQALFLAARDGRDEQLPFLRQLLGRYQTNRPAEQPWPAEHPIRNPRRITVEDRL